MYGIFGGEGGGGGYEFSDVIGRECSNMKF